jgi:hypothetical protein
LAPEYNFNIQARIPAALCAIHNFNAKYDSNKVLLPENTLGGFDNCHDRVKSAGVEPERASDTSVDHDQIAEMMWWGYQQTYTEMGEVDFDPNDKSLDGNDNDDDTDDNDDN